MVQATANMETAMTGRIKGSLRNIPHNNKIIMPQAGARIPICTNISVPKVSSATGSSAR